MVPTRAASILIIGLLLTASWGVGILGRGYWTPDEPREADIAWRMSWQAERSTPLLAGEPFCEKPPLTYWIAGAAIAAWGDAPWVARLPNVLYALLTTLAIAWIGWLAEGRVAGLTAAAAISTFLLSYQVGIWLATDAPLIAAVAVALLGLYIGFYADRRRERLVGYTLMHGALALGFLCKSAAAWMVPVLGILGLIVWERRWRELWRWELYLGLGVEAAIILPWVAAVAAAPDGAAHLKVFLWNNLAGRFAPVAAPQALQYTQAHRNSPGKYLIELPVYLWPWTLLVAAAVRRAWLRRNASWRHLRLLRFAVATFLPPLLLLSLAATARNIYLAPALPGMALLLGWWVGEFAQGADDWEVRAVRSTAVLMLAAVLVLATALTLLDIDAPQRPLSLWSSIVALAGLAASTVCALHAWRAAAPRTAGAPPTAGATAAGSAPPALVALLIAYCALLIGPASQIYRRVDPWQDLAALGNELRQASMGHPLIVFAQDETTRAFIDMYAASNVDWIAGPVTPASTAMLRARLAASPQSLVVVQLPGRHVSGLWRRLEAPKALDDAPPPPAWARELHLSVVSRYGLPNGRRYALLAAAMARP
jgi:4-amino-4-deoxy-L-arabinose transferase-like glycosyltransferase